MSAQGFTVGELAALAHVTVRTLHHYDAIGLLTPTGRTRAGYRTYTEPDLDRLRQILVYRELDFGLDEIATLLAEPGTAAADHLRRQHRLVRERISRGQDLLAALEKEMEARHMGISLTPEEQFEIFGSDRFTGEYAEEAEQRWGDTEAWQQSQRRASGFTKQDWVQLKAETDANEAGFAAALRAGEPVDSPRVRSLVDAHRAGVSRFWDCTPTAHRNLAEMFIADERFRSHYDDLEPGLAQYVHDAICATAAAGDP